MHLTMSIAHPYSDKPCHLLSVCTCDKTRVESHPYSMFVYVDTWQGNRRTQCPGPNIVDHNRGSGQTGFTPNACRLWHRQWRVGPAAEEEREAFLWTRCFHTYVQLSNSSFGFSSSYLQVLRPICFDDDLGQSTWVTEHNEKDEKLKQKTHNTTRFSLTLSSTIRHKWKCKCWRKSFCLLDINIAVGQCHVL